MSYASSLGAMQNSHTSGAPTATPTVSVPTATGQEGVIGSVPEHEAVSQHEAAPEHDAVPEHEATAHKADSAPSEEKEITSTEKLTALLPTFEAYVEQVQKTWGAPGIGVAIIKKGQIVYLKGFGVREVDTEKKVDPDTIFQIASLSKNMLAHLIVKLDQEGLLRLDDPVTKYVPNFRLATGEATKNFTIRDLISHRSGLPGFTGDSLWYVGFSTQELIESLRKFPLKSKPRQKYAYQNQVYGIASIIAEHVSGKTIDALMKEYFFTPLGMTRTSVGMQGVNPGFSLMSFLSPNDDNIAHPHDTRNDKAHSLAFSPLMYTFPGSTGVNVSIADYAKWMQFMLNRGKAGGKTIIDTVHYKELLTPHVTCHLKPDDSQFPEERYKDTKYGLGYFMSKYGEANTVVETYGHMGAFYGVRSLMMLAPSEELGIVVLSNFGSNRVSFVPEVLINKFMDLYLNLTPIDWNKKIREDFLNIKITNKRYKAMERIQNPAAPGPLEQYSGTYTNSLYGTFKISVKNKKLMFQYRDKEVTMEHFNGNQFMFPGHLLSCAFCESDVGYMYFGSKNGARDIDLMQVPSLLREGENEGLFEKVG